ncbi:hypothetical protein [Allomesorhizobium camelthorni]|uniref:Uncharacterized protein n=1 Tax=Allomesorhizobium camelthorni TaxID=475069 RepID=A0A6G4WND0_9HYPH|nr:hypothetical protein [Mesorhizobium camelthorni]NGO55706.1 hypothetical protein [Mesorhizobium camelthorni]
MWLKIEIGENLKRTHALDRNGDGYAASKKVLTQSDWQGIRAENWMERREQEAAKQEKARQGSMRAQQKAT